MTAHNFGLVHDLATDPPACPPECPYDGADRVEATGAPQPIPLVKVAEPMSEEEIGALITEQAGEVEPEEFREHDLNMPHDFRTRPAACPPNCPYNGPDRINMRDVPNVKDDDHTPGDVPYQLPEQGQPTILDEEPQAPEVRHAETSDGLSAKCGAVEPGMILTSIAAKVSCKDCKELLAQPQIGVVHAPQGSLHVNPLCGVKRDGDRILAAHEEEEQIDCDACRALLAERSQIVESRDPAIAEHVYGLIKRRAERVRSDLVVVIENAQRAMDRLDAGRPLAGSGRHTLILDTAPVIAENSAGALMVAANDLARLATLTEAETHAAIVGKPWEERNS